MLGKVSAAAAIVVGVLLAAFGAYQAVFWNIGFGATPLIMIATGLIAGGVLVFANWRRGARVLAGAWGVLAGMLFGSNVESAIEKSIDPLWGQGSYAVDLSIPVTLALASLPVVALVGMLLAVLHRRRPNAIGYYLGDKSASKP